LANPHNLGAVDRTSTVASGGRRSSATAVSRATSASSVASESSCGWDFKLGEWIVDDPVAGAKQSVGQLDLVRRCPPAVKA
jgi:hypothetical protein